MSARFWMKLNAQNVTQLTLKYPGPEGKEVVKTYSVFSGNASERNNPASVAKADAGPLPPGKYYVVDRESGGMLGPLRDWWSEKDIWFALYRDDGVINDSTVINGVTRGQFRMHPGTRSAGCVTFVKRTEFDEMRKILLSLGTQPIPGTSIEYYAMLEVE